MSKKNKKDKAVKQELKTLVADTAAALNSFGSSESSDELLDRLGLSREQVFAAVSSDDEVESCKEDLRTAMMSSGWRLYPDAFTPEQIENSQKGRLNDTPDIKTVEVTNPRTGQVVRIPADITPSFAHSHGDRLGALEALFGEKHGADAVEKMIAAREAYLAGKVYFTGLNTVNLYKKPPEKEVERLAKDASGNSRRHEAETAAQWQQAHGVRLEPYDADKPGGKPDFWVAVKDLPRSEWQTLDFMFTEDAANEYKIGKFNRYFADTAKRWEAQKDQIQDHLKKADIVPLDLRRLNALNRAKVLGYVLSLPQEQKDRIYIILGK